MASKDPAHILLWDILWNDPQTELGKNQGMRGAASMFFGPDVTEDFLRRNNLQLLVRSHQVGLCGGMRVRLTRTLRCGVSILTGD